MSSHLSRSCFFNAATISVPWTFLPIRSKRLPGSHPEPSFAHADPRRLFQRCRHGPTSASCGTRFGMTRVILFDLGLTLVDAHLRAFPLVMEAQGTIEQFMTAKGQPLVS